MNRSPILLLLALLLVTLTTSSCTRSGVEVWDDTKSASRYMGKGLRKLGGKQGRDGYQISREDFCRVEECSDLFDFVPLCDVEAEGLLNLEEMRLQPRALPGEPGGAIPGVEAFRDPSTNPELSHYFQNIHFDFDSSVIKGDANQERLRRIAQFLNKHPNIYIFIEGHCDLKGAQSYNTALGTRRANAVRKVLLELGVDKDHLFTVSYGKDRPLLFQENEEANRQNRRVEFKIYET